MATALVTQIAYAVQTLFDPAGTAGRLVDLGKLANYGLLTSFTPAALFTTGVNGAWYDPSDFSTMFQDAAGTTPVTAVGQPVGLMLDKSKGLVLGKEDVVAGGFFANNGWTAIGTGGVKVPGATIGSLYGPYSGAGRWYKMVITVSAINGTLTPQVGSAVSTAITTTGTHIRYMYPSVGTYWYLDGSSATTATVDNISVRELPGNHAVNPSGNSANFPVLSARYNLLTKTEDFDDAVWTKTNVSVTANAISAPDGTLTADQLVTGASAGTGSNTNQSSAVTSGIQYKYSIYVKAGNVNRVLIGQQFGNSSFTDNVFDLSTNTWVTPGFGTVDAIQVGNGWYRLSVTVTATGSGTYQRYVGPIDNNGTAYNKTTTGNFVYIWGADLRVANDALNQPAYQRVNTATDYDIAGFKPYLSFNGVNQWLQTNSIDFTYGDKIFVSAGVRKLSDASAGILLELSPLVLNAGAFLVQAPSAPSVGNYAVWTNGSTYSGQAYKTTPIIFAAPTSSVIASKLDNAASYQNQIVTRVNGSLVDSTQTNTTSSGNYGNYPLYIGARAGSAGWFNGRLYGLVVAGKQASASEIASTEAWLNQKTGAY